MILNVANLSKSYSAGRSLPKIHALSGLTLSVSKGEVAALVGPNGAGKTTAINLILGLLHADSGSVSMFGTPIGEASVRRKLGYQPEAFHTYGFLNAVQTLQFYGQLADMEPTLLSRRIPVVLERVGLEATPKPNMSYSKGMLQRLGLAQALLHEPELLILDEPTSGLDPNGRKMVADIVEQEQTKGTTVLLSSHILSDVERLCSHVIILDKGKTILSERLSDLNKTGHCKITLKASALDLQAATKDFNCSIEAKGNVAVIRCSEEEKSRLVKALANGDFEILDLRSEQKSLEAIYMDAVENE